MRLNQNGFSPVEILLATTLFALLVTGFSGIIILSQRSNIAFYQSQNSHSRSDAGLAAVRNIRDANFSNLVNGTYGLSTASGNWQFSGTSDTAGPYTRSVTISTVDADRRNISSTVQYNKSNGQSVQATLMSRLTNWAAYMKNWASPRVVGSADINGSGNGRKVVYKSNYAFIIKEVAAIFIGANPDLNVFDISDPANPVLVAALDLDGDLQNIAISGNYIYISATGTAQELQIFNISNPASPVLVGSYDAPGFNSSVSGIAVSGSPARLTKGAELLAAEVFIINVSNPATPSLLGSVETGQAMNEVYISNSRAYITSTSDTAELRVIDFSTPSAPTSLSTLDLSGTTDALTIDGYQSTVYIGQGTNLRIVNISNPAAPVQVGSVATSGTGIINDVALERTLYRYIFIGTGTLTAELQIAQIDNPPTATLVYTYDVPGNASTVNGLTFAADKRIAIAVTSSDTQELVMFEKN